MTRIGRLAAAGATALTVALLGLSTPAHADDTTGSITGHISADGQPVAAFVTLFDTQCSVRDSVNTDADNTFTFTNVQPGQYKLEFTIELGPDQWYHAQDSCETADLVTVVAGEQTVVEETRVPTGTVSGHVTDANGAPVSGLQVNVFGVDVGQALVAATDDSGAYQVPAPAGHYQVSFQFPNSFLTQYAHGKVSQSQADVFAVEVNQETVVDEQLLPTGSMSGRFTDATGQPVAGEDVEVVAAADQSFGTFGVTDENGDYTIPQVFGGDYKVLFISPDFSQTQWATGKTSFDTADTFTVTVGQNTVVSDQELPTGSVAVTATDARTGAPIANFCASVVSTFACSDGSGQALLTGVQQGDHEVFVDTRDGRYFANEGDPVTVVGGQTVDVTVALQPAAAITTTVVDASTGAPVPGACVWLTGVGNAILPDGDTYCGDDQGVVNIGPLNSGSFNLFAYARGSNYGAQWVGPRGGTGNQLLARVVKATVGSVTTVPVRLDPAGSITGTVTDAVTGAPVPFAAVGINTQSPGVGGGGMVTQADQNGHYTLDGLGPYRWPIVTWASGYASQWSGGTANRYFATPVRVPAGSSTVYNPALGRGTTLEGTARTASGGPVGEGYVSVVNAVTGDIMGSAFVDPADGVISAPVFGPQLVKISYVLQGPDGSSLYGWYGGRDEAHAKLVFIPPHGSVTIAITTP